MSHFITCPSLLETFNDPLHSVAERSPDGKVLRSSHVIRTFESGVGIMGYGFVKKLVETLTHRCLCLPVRLQMLLQINLSQMQ